MKASPAASCSLWQHSSYSAREEETRSSFREERGSTSFATMLHRFFRKNACDAMMRTNRARASCISIPTVSSWRRKTRHPVVPGKPDDSILYQKLKEDPRSATGCLSRRGRIPSGSTSRTMR